MRIRSMLAHSGEIYIPLIAAAITSVLFTLLGFFLRAWEQAGVEPPVWQIVLISVLNLLGFISMAFVILMKYDLGKLALILHSNGQPKLWRRCSLALSIGCLILFDIFSMIAAVFAAWPVFIVAAPVFVGYIVFNRIAFAGLELAPF